MDKSHKILLLGGAGAGKSTFLNALRCLKEDPMQSVAAQAKAYITRNVFNDIRVCLEYAHEQGITFDGDLARIARQFRTRDDVQLYLLSEDLSREIRLLWNHEIIQKIWRERSKIVKPWTVNAAYFLNQLKTISRAEYVPTARDILSCRGKTSGCEFLDYELKGNKFEIVDVGGTLNERRKWPQLFNSLGQVDTVFFFVGLSFYCRPMEDSEEQPGDKDNRLKDSLELFHMIADLPRFMDTRIVLIITQKDEFAKLLEHNMFLPTWDQEFDGSLEHVNSCIDFIVSEFQAKTSLHQVEVEIIDPRSLGKLRVKQDELFFPKDSRGEAPSVIFESIHDLRNTPDSLAVEEPSRDARRKFSLELRSSRARKSKGRKQSLESKRLSIDETRPTRRTSRLSKSSNSKLQTTSRDSSPRLSPKTSPKMSSLARSAVLRTKVSDGEFSTEDGSARTSSDETSNEDSLAAAVGGMSGISAGTNTVLLQSSSSRRNSFPIPPNSRALLANREKVTILPTEVKEEETQLEKTVTPSDSLTSILL